MNIPKPVLAAVAALSLIAVATIWMPVDPDLKSIVGGFTAALVLASSIAALAYLYGTGVGASWSREVRDDLEAQTYVQSNLLEAAAGKVADALAELEHGETGNAANILDALIASGSLSEAATRAALNETADEKQEASA